MINKRKTVIIAAGGTGGHVFPGLVIAQAFKEIGIEVIWIGTNYGIESKLVNAHHVPFYTVPIRGIRGVWLKKLTLPFRLFISVLKSIILIYRFQPSGILGMGGYPAFPAGIACWLTRRPLIIHEQNTLPGLVNKVLVNFANVSLTAYPNVFSKKNTPSYLVGNPVRQIMYKIPKKIHIDEAQIKILVVGGSQGAHFFNTKLPELFASLSNKRNIKIVHQTGLKSLPAVESLYNNSGLNVSCKSFIDKMDEVYSWADLVIARAGALTLSELMAAGRASILIPFPNAADDHQTKNANFLVKNNAAVVWQQKNYCLNNWAKELQSLLRDKQKLIKMSNSAKLLSHKDSVNTIIKHCMENYFE